MNADIPTPTLEPRPAPPRLLIVDDDEELRDTLARRFARAGIPVTMAESGEEALAKIGRSGFDLALFDLHLPGMSGLDLLAKFKEAQPDAEVLLLTAHGSIGTAIEAMRRGAYDYFTKPFQLTDLEVHLQKAYEKVRLSRRQRQWQEQVRFESPRYRLVGSGPAMKCVVTMIEKVSATEATVLVYGPSGSGKELVARAIHSNSERRDQPLVTINCAALQETLLESELFGHERGAFTGAVHTKPGLIEVAEGGTLFIDEVGEMAPGLQAKLLRVLEDGHFRRVGGTEELQADVRVVAATNRPLGEEQQAGRFREDLYYRLNVIAIALPPLRERREDIPELVAHFLTTRPVGGGRCRIAPEALEALKRYDWPGNVRELANVLERAQILAENHLITPDDLPENLVEAVPAAGAPGDPRRLRDVERRHVHEILRQEKGNKVQAAKSLGISRRALYRLIAKYHLETPGR
ncbi:MAG TPA: sigma-54 dependent transcriptional regulator [Gemmataceae bacterium]|nr:sigma-54 dependent transcriptional regulator [Gemmataceae bacterium]